MTRIQDLVYRLAMKHHFSMLNPEDALWVADPGGSGTLVITIRENNQGFVVARAFPAENNQIELTGFRVYYDFNWNPIAAVNEIGSVLRDPQKANEKMCSLIETYFLTSDNGWVRSREYSPFRNRR